MSDEAAAPPAKKSPMKMILVIAVILAVEAVVLVGGMMMLGGPSGVDAAELAPPDAEEEQIVEILVVDDKLPNNKLGVTYLYKTEVYIQVKKKYEEEVNKRLSQCRFELKSEIVAIWKASEPRHFQEPKLENLTRKTEALLRERFGNDAKDDVPLIEKCVIVMQTGFRIDS